MDELSSCNDNKCLPSLDLAETPEASQVESTITYPEGGINAWLVVLGAFCGLASSIGIYNTSGIFEIVVSKEILPDVSSSNLGWIFSIYGFMVWICGAQVGGTFDAMGPRALLLIGSACTLAGIFSLSFCKGYYQIFLAFSILTGIGSSLLLTPSMGCVAHWFNRRRGLASGIAFMGSGVGGVLLPLTIQSLLPSVGWGWTIRIIGFILLILCSISLAFCKSRIPPRNGNATTWRDTLPDHRIFLDGTGAMAVTTMGVVFMDMAYFIPMTYIPAYYIDRQGLSNGEALTGSSAFAYQLLAIANASSCMGRYVAGDLADRFGRYNMAIVSLFFCVISVLCFWLPDIMTSFENPALVVIFMVLFGFVSGSNVSLTPICLGQLCEIQEYGRYYASCYTVVAFGVLVSVPIAGALLDSTDQSGRAKYWAAALFTGIIYVGAFLCFAWVRVKVKGWNWQAKW